ncbi:MAG: hypothetical protein CMN05_04385 [Roseibacillus sp.]|mgnify:FL=1|jgi:DUF971 family protein|nr:hypothetical protein [Roseibacillus sp.]MCP4731665.1 DUF971 domain-containing protein [Roseibacillus sp.]MDP6207684.1 DUF971 domain-containing protein [Roseibacillus sp.]MDP7305999.1 DUF971 domain-containing protein [Roseibacillus sp.]MDP7655096.1 DUF971 domain-containing protein [Roseibacillus sp.]|tara:strand:- start:7711 stop:8031 length:321 start_codon:yes stop_codon:yes gene_type:complete
MLSIENIVVAGNELAIAWADGKESYLDLETLRRACPCASCQGEPDATGRVVKPQVSYNERSFLLGGYQLVGGYALQFHFADEHGTGIYSFSYLRELGASSPGKGES